VDDHWQNVTGTPPNHHQLCLTTLSLGSTLVESVTMSNEALGWQTEDNSVEITPGLYRFILLGPSPFLATDFQVTSADD
jgi:hypothetical protein